MVKISAITCVAFICIFLTTSVAVPQEDTGVIKGTITAQGVRSPEDILVYIEEAPGEFAPTKKAVMTQKKLTFIPHVLPVVKGTTVEFQNDDPLLHNIFWPASKEGPYPGHNLGTWGTGATKEFTFEKEGHVVLLCNIHSEMEGHIVILQNPFFAVTNEDGEYEIRDVPPGSYTLKTWYSNPRRLRSKSAEVTVKAGETTEQDFSLSRR